MERAAVRANPERETNVLARPIVSFGREICGDLASALRHEWIVTNGLGKYAGRCSFNWCREAVFVIIPTAKSRASDRMTVLPASQAWALRRSSAQAKPFSDRSRAGVYYPSGRRPNPSDTFVMMPAAPKSTSAPR
jgi:hypothetical protein